MSNQASSYTELLRRKVGLQEMPRSVDDLYFRRKYRSSTDRGISDDLLVCIRAARPPCKPPTPGRERQINCEILDSYPLPSKFLFSVELGTVSGHRKFQDRLDYLYSRLKYWQSSDFRIFRWSSILHDGEPNYCSHEVQRCWIKMERQCVPKRVEMRKINPASTVLFDINLTIETMNSLQQK